MCVCENIKINKTCVRELSCACIRDDTRNKKKCLSVCELNECTRAKEIVTKFVKEEEKHCIIIILCIIMITENRFSLAVDDRDRGEDRGNEKLLRSLL